MELLIAMAIIVVVAAIAVPAYRDYITTARDAALVKQLRTLVVFQEDLKLRTGAYGAGDFDRGKGVSTLTANLGWRPSGDDGIVYRVTADGGESWTAIATDASGRRMCRVFPAGVPCA